MWLIPLTIFFVAGTASNLLRRHLAQKDHLSPNLINLVFYVGFILPGGLILGLLLPHTFTPDLQTLGLLVFCSLIWPLYFLLAFKANKHIDASVFSMIADLSPIVTAMIAYFLFTERLTSLQLVGVLALILSGVIAMYPDITSKVKVRILGIQIALVCMLLLGVGFAVEKQVYDVAGIGTYFLFCWTLQVLWMVIIARKEIHLLPELFADKRERMLVLLHGFAGLLRSASFAFALLLSTSASLMNAASNFLTACILIAAYFILGEKSNLRFKIAGSAVGLVGLFLVWF